MNLDGIIGIIIVPAVFIWIGLKIYKHEKEHIDPMIETVKGWFAKKEDVLDDRGGENMEYKISYQGAEY